MRTGLAVGDQIEISITVDESMRASLLGKPIHPLYGTAAMIEHMEWAARQHILPYLQPGEEGVGYHVDVKHLAPAPLGADIRICSTVTELQPRRVISQVAAWWGQTLIGEGQLTQALVPVEKLYACVAEQSGTARRHPEFIAEEETNEEAPAPPPARLLSQNGKDRLSLEVLRWENGLFACTRYDEWLICRVQIESDKNSAAYEGAFLLRYELEEWLEAIQNLAQSQRNSYHSEFLEPVLTIEMASGEVSEWACSFQLAPPEESSQRFSMIVDANALQTFAEGLIMQLEGFPSRL